MIEELKPCPFCGNDVAPRVEHSEETMLGSPGFIIVCAGGSGGPGGCGASTGWHGRPQTAISDWNTRAESAEVERLRARVAELEIGYAESEVFDMGVQQGKGQNAALRARIAELEAAQAWRPIKEAPMGEYVLTLVNGKHHILMYRQSYDFIYTPQHGSQCLPSFKAWRDQRGVQFVAGVPTAWMPLPKGPEES